MTVLAAMTPDTVPTDFTVSLAVADILPVFLFGLSALILSRMLKIPLFSIGAALSISAGVFRVLWKFNVVLNQENTWWLFSQMRILMPLGFLMMIAAVVLHRDDETVSALIRFCRQPPVLWFLLTGLACFILILVLAFVLDGSDPTSNWIEQTVHIIWHLTNLVAVLLLNRSMK